MNQFSFLNDRAIRLFGNEKLNGDVISVTLQIFLDPELVEIGSWKEKRWSSTYAGACWRTYRGLIRLIKSQDFVRTIDLHSVKTLLDAGLIEIYLRKVNRNPIRKQYFTIVIKNDDFEVSDRSW